VRLDLGSHPGVPMRGVIQRAAARKVKMVKGHTGAFSHIPRRKGAPEAYMKLSRPSRAWGMPGARCTRGPCARKNAHGSHHESTGNTRHSRTRMVLTAYIALSPATNSSCHRRRRIEGFARPGWANQNLRRLDTSNGCQDHTVLPSAAAFAKRLRRHVHVRRSLSEAGFSAVRLSRPDRSQAWKARPAITLRARRCRVHRIPSQRS
jgi:hypothetical protein